MAGLFPKQAPTEKTVLLIDIENGSVGCALVRVPVTKSETGTKSNLLPKLFAETRIALPITSRLDLPQLMRDTHAALREALSQTSITAARMRTHPKLSSVGVISAATVCVAAPWTAALVQGEGIDWHIEPELQKLVRRAIEESFGDIRVSFYPTSAAVAHATDYWFDTAPQLLLCTVTAEVTELSLLEGGALAAHATIPLGKRFFLRTLASHAGLSYPEAHSALQLARMSTVETPAEEALHAAGTQFASVFTSAARQLQADTSPSGILVVAGEPLGAWIAHMLVGQEALTRTFAEGTPIQALHTHHLTPYLAAHATKPDIICMIEALFINRTN